METRSVVQKIDPRKSGHLEVRGARFHPKALRLVDIACQGARCGRVLLTPPSPEPRAAGWRWVCCWVLPRGISVVGIIASSNPVGLPTCLGPQVLSLKGPFVMHRGGCI